MQVAQFHDVRSGCRNLTAGLTAAIVQFSIKNWPTVASQKHPPSCYMAVNPALIAQFRLSKAPAPNRQIRRYAQAHVRHHPGAHEIQRIAKIASPILFLIQADARSSLPGLWLGNSSEHRRAAHVSVRRASCVPALATACRLGHRARERQRVVVGDLPKCSSRLRYRSATQDRRLRCGSSSLQKSDLFYTRFRLLCLWW